MKTPPTAPGRGDLCPEVMGLEGCGGGGDKEHQHAE